ncbi:MAG: nitronate monooxygenase [Candidatus Omnitrophota bacterium]|nr:MAG: nitronate monooxygenase [Candidatus Omnitrophota bacterium]
MLDKLNPLIIGDKEVKIPIVQGGMGVMVSRYSLASAVASCGAMGTIASVGLGYGSPENETNYLQASLKGLEKEIQLARASTKGVVGVNNMVALTNYAQLVRVAVKEKADFIASGAGLPLKLPEFAEGSAIKLIPIVSSGRATDVIIKTWKKRYNRLPDAVIVEGPLAGGHLGFRVQDLSANADVSLENLVIAVLKVVRGYEQAFNVSIPVIAAGGIFDGKDISRFLKLGASGVQMATRFVATFECSVTDKFKNLYIAAKKDDITIIKSPVGMPGRVIKTKFIEKLLSGKKEEVKCNYKCLKTCNPRNVPYCIAKALFNAVRGDLDNAVVFAGSNAVRVKKIVSVKNLIDELVADTLRELNKNSK